jgi:predicted nucleotidyltransferase
MNPTVAKLLHDHRTDIAKVCQRYDVQSLRLFGSGLGLNWHQQSSDLDFLAQYGPLRPDGFKGLVGLKVDLEQLLETSVDIIDDQHSQKASLIVRSIGSSQLVYEA